MSSVADLLFHTFLFRIDLFLVKLDHVQVTEEPLLNTLQVLLVGSAFSVTQPYSRCKTSLYNFNQACALQSSLTCHNTGEKDVLAAGRSLGKKLNANLVFPVAGFGFVLACRRVFEAEVTKKEFFQPYLLCPGSLFSLLFCSWTNDLAVNQNPGLHSNQHGQQGE